jgi:hypothetical protein
VWAGDKFHSFLDSAVDGGEWSALCSDSFESGDKSL